jgi:hypothetical protein
MTVANELRDRVVALAIDGLTPSEIYEEIEQRAEYETIRVWITNARRSGFEIPMQPRHRKSHGANHQSVFRSEAKPKAASEPLTEAEERMLAELARRNVGITCIAAKMRKPYAVVIEAIDRLGLSRARTAG